MLSLMVDWATTMSAVRFTLFDRHYTDGIIIAGLLGGVMKLSNAERLMQTTVRLECLLQDNQVSTVLDPVL